MNPGTATDPSTSTADDAHKAKGKGKAKRVPKRTPKNAAKTSPARVNLMPPAETERRERLRLVRGWGWGLVGALALVLVLSGGAFALTWSAEQRLAAAQARTNDLLAQLASLSEVSQALSTETELTGFRSEAMSYDLEWRPVLDSVTTVLPAGVEVVGFVLTTGGAPAAESADTTQPDPAAEAANAGLSGTITLESGAPVDTSPAVRSLRAVPAITEVDVRELTSEDGEGASVYTYVLTATFDQSVYSGAYTEAEDR
ncbi:hypothetical protein M4I32_10035 [Microbacterium sp. LRZ72]|uniref:hypothetical protein n=1 Tax=Microbacterium sp. LRZ72 TaxID=2942481 RepID=UPI0029B398C0|nr:hypothetical protein [Microbacterium sp. LRZ72]MDX2377137.1 hypothetical protein [Microbacterium sp. LRZ72]